ncbi:hypothetical protein CL614_09260 [archaeon]|nr:hypothetical protein [archaeon]|tara:strand:- start:1433 stop:1969 length:537 start_codon:yes stop_codon:yes gene_type:complete
MIKEAFICFALLNMNGIINQENICNNIYKIQKVSKKYKIKSDLFVSLLWVESNFNPTVVSPGNACGISQVLPKYTDKTCDQLKEIPIGLEYGAKALSYWINIYAKGNDMIGLCAFNAGFRCKGETLSEKDKRAFKRGYNIYAKNVKKFQKRLNRQVKKQQKKFEKSLRSIIRVLKNNL